MIEREITLPDERVFRFHEFRESIVDLENKKLYALTASWDDLVNREYVVLQAVVNFSEWTPDLLEGLDDVIATADLSLFNGLKKAVEITAETLKDDKIKAINTQRDLAEKSGFIYMDRPIDSDMQSVNRINTAFNSAMACFVFGTPFTIEWTCADNLPLVLDAQGMIGMPGALAKHAETLHNRAKELKALVNAITSTDLDEVRDLLAEIPVS